MVVNGLLRLRRMALVVVVGGSQRNSKKRAIADIQYSRVTGEADILYTGRQKQRPQQKSLLGMKNSPGGDIVVITVVILRCWPIDE